ncbi:MAG: ketose-bisphosphate aldolase, partial [Desulfobacterales bacterium]
GAQHGTSGNNSDKLRAIAANTRTTKANVATALQMVSWGLEVNDYGNAVQDSEGNFIKIEGQGVTEEIWASMTAYAAEQGWTGGNYKKLNLPFESLILSQPANVRERMVGLVDDFVYKMLTDVFNAAGTGTIAKELIMKAGSYDLGPKATKIENEADWTKELIIERARTLDADKGPEGDFDD